MTSPKVAVPAAGLACLLLVVCPVGGASAASTADLETTPTRCSFPYATDPVRTVPGGVGPTSSKVATGTDGAVLARSVTVSAENASIENTTLDATAGNASVNASIENASTDAAIDSSPVDASVGVDAGESTTVAATSMSSPARDW